MYEELKPTEPEQMLIDAAAHGEVADFRTGHAEQDDPAAGESWGEERTIRAEIVFCLATGLRSDWSVHPKGVRVCGAKIVDVLDFHSATFRCPLFLLQSWFEKEIVLIDARTKTIGLNGSRVPGLIADRVVTKGNVFLNRGFHSTGEVRLAGADIAGNLEFTGARLDHDGQVALTVDGATIKGNVFLRAGFHVTGVVCLVGVHIGGQLDCAEGRFENPEGNAILAHDLRVAGALVLRRLERPIEGAVRLNHARIGIFVDDAESWPAPGGLYLDGFVYEAIDESAPTDWKTRLEWLRRQPEGVFWPQPYEQLAKVLRQMGHERDAREIGYEKEEARRRQGDLSAVGKLVNRFFGCTVGHGYKPWWAFYWIAGFIVLGTVLFYLGQRSGLMVPTAPRVYLSEPYATHKKPPPEYPVFQSLVYATDTFLPIVDLHQERFWLPNRSAGRWGLALWVYLWLHIACGWVLSTVAVAGLTGLVRKD